MSGMADGRGDGERTVVVVEDDAHIADLLDLYLREVGFRVLQAATGARGLDLIGQHRPAIALLDIGLPDLDHFQLGRPGGLDRTRSEARGDRQPTIGDLRRPRWLADPVADRWRPHRRRGHR